MMNHTLASVTPNVDSGKWIERLARWGFAAKGVVYVLIGILAVMAAIGQDKNSASKSGVAQMIFEQPFGKFLAIILVIGLFGYVVWRLVEAVNDPHHRGNDTKGILQRIGYGISGLIYAGFAGSIVKAIVGQGQSGGGQAKQNMAAKIMSMDAGPFLIAAAGIIVMVLGGKYIYKAYKNKFGEKMNMGRMKTELRTWINRIGKIGYTARGIVWMLIGFFALRAGLTTNPSDIKGSQGAFNLIEQSTGSWVLLIVALGVVAYGIYMFVKAKYYQISLH
jgi:hypothetical protein